MDNFVKECRMSKKYQHLGFCRINFFLGLYHTICSNLFQKYTTYCVSYLRKIVNATEPSCVVSLIDRLVHHSEVVAIEGESYRLKEAKERAEQRTRKLRKGKS